VDEGSPGRVEYIGSSPYRTPGRDPKVWHSVVVVPHYAVADDAEEARVVVRTWDKHAAKDDYVGSLANVADRLARGELRLAREGEHLAPRVVTERLGWARSWKDVLRVEVEGQVAWVGRDGSWAPMVLDDAGRLVRKKRLREAAEAALRAKTFGGQS
jgi:hypothetical protein